MKASELRDYLDTVLAMYGDVELPDAVQFGELPNHLPRSVTQQLRDRDVDPFRPGGPYVDPHGAYRVLADPPFAPELQHADRRDTGEPDHYAGQGLMDGAPRAPE